MKRIIILILLTLPFSGIFANNDFSQKVNELADLLQPFTVKKGEYVQTLSEVEPGIILFSYTFTDLKGKKEVNEFEINLTNIDIHTIKETTIKQDTRDIIYVQVMVNKGQKFIKHTINGKTVPYVNGIRIFSNDINNAYEIRDAFKELVPMAKRVIKKRINTPTLQDKIDFVSQHIITVNITDTDFEQTILFDEIKIGSITYNRTETSGKKTSSEEYTFNLADINENTVGIRISGAKVFVKLETKRNMDLIWHTKNLKDEMFVNSVELLAPSIDVAQDLIAVIKEAIPFLRREIEQSLPNNLSLEDMITMLNTYIAGVSVNFQSHDQMFSPHCITELSVATADNDGPINISISFNFSDINPDNIDYLISGNILQLVLQTKTGEKLIKQFINEETVQYTNKAVLVFESNDNVLLSTILLKRIIEYCSNNYLRMLPEGDTQSKIDWLTRNIKEVTFNGMLYGQSFRQNGDGEQNSFIFEIERPTNTGTVDMLYELKLKDIDPRSISFNISDDKLSVVLKSHYADNLFKVYNNGVLHNNVNSVQIYFENVETARNAIGGFKEIIETIE